MLPLLMTLEGNKQPFEGTALYNPRSSTAYPRPGFGTLTQDEEEQVTTLEVAGLYLISAIYNKDLYFADAVLLTDLTVPRADRKARNSPDLLARAWKSVKSWMIACQQNGVEAMRAQNSDPLAAARVAWY